MQYLQGFQLLLQLGHALLFLVQFSLKSYNPAAYDLFASSIKTSLLVPSSISSIAHQAVDVCYTDLSSAVLSKLICGKVAEALLAGLDSGKADGDA